MKICPDLFPLVSLVKVNGGEACPGVQRNSINGSWNLHWELYLVHRIITFYCIHYHRFFFFVVVVCALVNVLAIPEILQIFFFF